MRRSPDKARTRPNFENRSVQLIAAWTLVMGGLGAAQTTLPARGAGAASSHAVALSAPATGLPPLTARLTRQ
ncbi:MAG: hypothetical protein IBJ14_08755 [Hydrogenophaga sp.]|nr:hypothetical protein [Hydrogenophaga sp.]